MTTQSIIVYRNPAEAAFWESGMAVPLGGGLVTFLIAMVALNYIAGKVIRKWKDRTSDRVTAGTFFVSAILGVLVFKYLWI